MWIYIPYYRQVCKKPFQNKVLDTIDQCAETIQVVNKSGNTIIKHKITVKQFAIITRGIAFK